MNKIQEETDKAKAYSKELKFEEAIEILENLIFKNMKCVQCGELIFIVIQKTSAGFGFLNGIISEPTKGQLIALSSICNRKKEGK